MVQVQAKRSNVKSLGTEKFTNTQLLDTQEWKVVESFTFGDNVL